MKCRTVLIMIVMIVFFGCTMNPQDLNSGSSENGDNGGSQGSDEGGDWVQDNSTANTNDSVTSTDGQNGGGSSGALTMNEVAMHNSPADCWVVIDGLVYDLPQQFVEDHAGGSTIPYCGTDMSAEFNQVHGPTSIAKAEQYVIGELGTQTVNEVTTNQSNENPATTTPEGSTTNQSATDQSQDPVPAISQITLDMNEVAKHDTKQDCWMVIDNTVLNLTSFTNHPGGSTYVRYCGTDATNVFDNIHSSSATSMFGPYTLGQLGEVLG